MRSTLHTTRAFTIVEILAALAILGLAVFGTYRQLLATSRQGRSQLTRIQAGLLAQQELEQLRATPFAHLQAWKPTPAAFYPNHQKFVYQDQIAARPGDAALELTVRVGWDMPLGGPSTPPAASPSGGSRRHEAKATSHTHPPWKIPGMQHAA